MNSQRSTPSRLPDSTRELDLSAAQRGIWLGHQRSPDPSIYNCAEQLVIDGPFSGARFEAALAASFQAASSLHFAFVEVEGVPKARSVVARLDYEHIDVSGEPDAERAMGEHTRRLIETPLRIHAGELCKHRLFRLSPSRYVWLHLAHHIALDGYGFQLFAKAVAQHYQAGSVPEFTDVEAVLVADESYQQSTQRRLDEAFWLQGPGSGAGPVWLGDSPGTNLQHMYLEPAAPLRVAAELPEHFMTHLREIAASVGGRWPEALTAVVAAHLHGRTGRRRFALGMPVMLRLGTPALKVPCMAMNIVRVPVVVAPGTTLRRLTRELSARQRLAAPHYGFRYEELGSKRFGPVLNIMPFDVPNRFGDAAATARGLAAGPVADLSISFVPHERTLRVVFDGHPGLYGAGDLRSLLDEFCAEALTLLERPDQLLVVSGPQRPNSGVPDVVRSIVDAASKTPSHAALTAGGKQLSYATLLDWASIVAARLSQQGVEPGSLVALDLPRSLEAVATILGTLLAGACYMPLDPNHPVSRRRELLRQVHPLLLVGTAPWELGLGPSEQPRWLSRSDVLECLRADEAASKYRRFDLEQSLALADPRDAAYVVFTSGSTGAPKGVVVSRGALSAYAHAAQVRYRIRATDRVLQFASLAFDASVEELFVTLSAGASLVIRDDDMVASTPRFFETARALEISVLNLPTAYWHELAWAVNHEQCAVPRCVHTVIIGGEAADDTAVRRWVERVPNTRLLNTYGPSEATVVATCCDLAAVSLEDGVPIGTALPGVQTYVGPAPQSQVPQCGELLLAGPTLADGYLDRPDLTRQRFVPAPDGEGRAYRTGDLVRQRADGMLVYLGRVDDEVKLSGYRIVPAEIEAALGRHPRVRASVVLPSPHASPRGLVAHVEVEGASTAKELREFLSRRLPAPMIPTAWQLHERLPRTATGKLDRSALRNTSKTLPPSSAVQQLAANPLEAAVLQTYCDVLGTSEVALNDDFFGLGGTSLQLIQVANRLSRLCSGVSVATLFAHPTPRALALALGTMAPGDKQSDGRAGLGQQWSLALPPATSRRDDRAALGQAAGESGVIVLTGAAGFVGVYLLAQLLQRTRARIVCIVRERGGVVARERLEAQLRSHGLWSAEFARRVDVAAADLKAADLGSLLPARCDQVVHTAADVSLVRDFESLQRSNVASTRSLLEYAAASGAAFHQVSTLAVVPAWSAGQAGSEVVCPQHDGLIDGYQQTKWQAEQLCQQAAAFGYPVSIYRLGRVTGARDEPRVNPRDLVWRIARASVRAEVWPSLDFEEPWIPVDDAAATMVDLMTRSAPSLGNSLEVFHLAQTGNVDLRRLRRALQRVGFALDSSTVPDWVRRVRHQADDEDQATLAFFELLETRAMPKPSATTYCVDRLLEALPGLKRQPVSDELLLRYCQRAIDEGFLPRPPGS